jgi:hypothetical protein
MRLTTIASLCTASLTAVTLSAQTGVRTPAPSHEPAHDTKVLTGCLVADPDGSSFKLTNALPSVQPSNAPVGTSGKGAEYELRAETRLDAGGPPPPDLKQFVGRQVEITARPLEETPPPASAQKPAAAGEPQAAPPANPETAPVEKLNVTVIKQVSGSCK